MNVSLKKVMLVGVLVATMNMGAFALAVAAGNNVEVNTSYSIKQILSSFTGQRVALRTDCGESIEGTVVGVGDHIVHISRLAGKDYYDAVVVIDRISSVVFRARGN